MHVRLRPSLSASGLTAVALVGGLLTLGSQFSRGRDNPSWASRIAPTVKTERAVAVRVLPSGIGALEPSRRQDEAGGATASPLPVLRSERPPAEEGPANPDERGAQPVLPVSLAVARAEPSDGPTRVTERPSQVEVAESPRPETARAGTRFGRGAPARRSARSDRPRRDRVLFHLADRGSQR